MASSWAKIGDLKATNSPTLFPSVLRLIHAYSLQASTLLKLGTGPKGRLTKGDVLKHIEAKSLKPSPSPLSEFKSTSSGASAAASSSASASAAPAVSTSSSARINRKRTGASTYTDIQLDNMRRVIAQRLTESKTTVPHEYATREIDLVALSDLRKTLNASRGDGEKLSVTDFLIRASALALRQVPETNAQFDTKTKEVKLVDNVDISLAVAIDGGLITPIIPAADKKGLGSIATTSKDLVKRARSKALKPHEFQGGTFSVSNLGMFGITEFSAVLNPPQAMILAVGGPLSTVVATETGAPKATTTMRVTLSYDARVVSADSASKWLDSFHDFLTNPTLMML